MQVSSIARIVTSAAGSCLYPAANSHGLTIMVVETYQFS